MAPVQDWFLGLLGRRPRTEEGRPRGRGQAIHVIILDGTMSTLDDGYETNAGITFKLLKELGPKDNVTLHYEAGIQWRDWSSTYGVLTGKGLNRQIERAYGVLASRYVPGDRIFLIGYSRGAYAVRSLAGVIDRVGLVRADVATERNIRGAYRHYRAEADLPATADFKRLFCHDNVWIEAVGVWDTVKALGGGLPKANTSFTTKTWSAMCITPFTRSPSTRRGRPMIPFSGAGQRAGPARWCKCGFAARTAILAGRWTTRSRRGRCRTSRLSGCWNSFSARACLSPTNGVCASRPIPRRRRSAHGAAGPSFSSSVIAARSVAM
jgi:hypothetical protein